MNRNIKEIEDLMISKMLIATMNWSIKGTNEQTIKEIQILIKYRTIKGTDDLMLLRMLIGMMNWSIKGTNDQIIREI